MIINTKNENYKMEYILKVGQEPQSYSFASRLIQDEMRVNRTGSLLAATTSAMTVCFTANDT